MSASGKGGGDGPVVVLGAGGHAKVVVGTLQEAGVAVARLLDDDPARQGTEVLGAPVRGTLQDAMTLREPALIGIGDERLRGRIDHAYQCRWFRAVHPTAWMHRSVPLGEGSVVLAHATVQPGTSIGRHAIVNTAASVDHDNHLGDYVQVGPGARLAGNVTLEEGAFVGTGATLLPDIRVGAWSVVGAGSVVTKDVPPGVVTFGVPARPVRKIPVPSFLSEPASSP